MQREEFCEDGFEGGVGFHLNHIYGTRIQRMRRIFTDFSFFVLIRANQSNPQYPRSIRSIHLSPHNTTKTDHASSHAP